MSLQRRNLLAGMSASAFSAAVLGKDAAAESVTYSYDEVGRLKTVTYGNGATITYAYDPAGNRTTLTQTAGSPAPDGSLAANPGTITLGSSSSLSWSSSNAVSAAIDNSVGTVTPVAGGSVSVSPSTTTTYTLALTGPGGQTTKQATVTVSASAPTGTLSATPTSINSGGSSTLSWTSANATSASIDNGVGPVTPVAGGSVQVSPSATSTYTLTLTGPGGQTTKQATVSVTGFNQTIQITGSGPVNLRTLANSAGYNGAQNATITYEVGNGVTITGLAGGPDAAGGIAIDTGAWPTGSHTIALTLVIKTGGTVRGGGGGGGSGGTAGPGDPGGAGGDAIYCRLPLSGGITVQSGGTVQGGGAGGAGGDSYDPEPLQFGNPTDGGGGGGGGRPNSAGGYGSPGDAEGGGGNPGASGSAGSTSAAGSGGAGGGGAAAGAPGGSYGGGYAIRKNGHAVIVTNNGTIVGAQG